LREIFGWDINGAGVVDGWRAYNIIPVLQRCWAHLIRDVDAFIEQPGGKELSEAIYEKCKALKEFIGKDPPTSMEERKQQKEVWDMEMAELVEQFSKSEELKKPVTYIRNGLGNWYTCLLYPGMEPTNNLSEQVIREHVLMRKIIGTFRSEEGAEYYQYISLLSREGKAAVATIALREYRENRKNQRGVKAVCVTMVHCNDLVSCFGCFNTIRSSDYLSLLFAIRSSRAEYPVFVFYHRFLTFSQNPIPTNTIIMNTAINPSNGAPDTGSVAAGSSSFITLPFFTFSAVSPVSSGGFLNSSPALLTPDTSAVSFINPVSSTVL